ncbi:MAG: hypothetical protein ACLTW7_15865 [Enterococcus sp.]|uniref:hypothetical protein n=1 Tax=Enterococcus sp. TaxID=35783 RepID=UPI003995BC00
METISGLRTEFNGSQDYDFVLRATEAAKEIHHVRIFFIIGVQLKRLWLWIRKAKNTPM